LPSVGKPLNSTLPVDDMQFGCVIGPTTGIEGLAVTVNEYVAVAAVHVVPLGILVVTVIVTTIPASLVVGV
jgi:hypothetical protein